MKRNSEGLIEKIKNFGRNMLYAVPVALAMSGSPAIAQDSVDPKDFCDKPKVEAKEDACEECKPEPKKDDSPKIKLSILGAFLYNEEKDIVINDLISRGSVAGEDYNLRFGLERHDPTEVNAAAIHLRLFDIVGLSAVGNYDNKDDRLDKNDGFDGELKLELFPIKQLQLFGAAGNLNDDEIYYGGARIDLEDVVEGLDIGGGFAYLRKDEDDDFRGHVYLELKLPEGKSLLAGAAVRDKNVHYVIALCAKKGLAIRYRGQNQMNGDDQYHEMLVVSNPRGPLMSSGKAKLYVADHLADDSELMRNPMRNLTPPDGVFAAGSDGGLEGFAALRFSRKGDNKEIGGSAGVYIIPQVALGGYVMHSLENSDYKAGGQIILSDGGCHWISGEMGAKKENRHSGFDAKVVYNLDVGKLIDKLRE